MNSDFFFMKLNSYLKIPFSELSFFLFFLELTSLAVGHVFRHFFFSIQDIASDGFDFYR